MSDEGKRQSNDESTKTVEQEMGDLPEADIKVILLGDSAVGKSKLVERFLLQDYHPRQLSTYALTLFRYADEVYEQSVKVDFWDTAGRERFDNMHPSYYFGAHACILAFDVTRKATYKNLNKWYTELRKYRENIPVIVVANKIDVDYKVTRKTFAFPKKKGLPPVEYVSAADGTNVVHVFQKAIRDGWNYKNGGEKDFMEECLDLLGEDFGEGL